MPLLRTRRDRTGRLPARGARAGLDQRTNSGVPFSGKGMSIVSKSRGASVAANTERASSRRSRPGSAWRCGSARAVAPARRARPAPPGARWSDRSGARARCSSSANVASCTSRSASCAASVSTSHGEVSPEITILRPSRVGPITCSGLTPATVSPRVSLPKSGPGVTPSLARARGRDGRDGSPR